mmetsp:Transcript_16973/g.33806  ORF Transcript_16973/g.33806 Transcript_16973/m.33806 type:complete len:348 (-) Transcript_16973:566-1609(-)
MSNDRAEIGSSSTRTFPGRLLVARYLSHPTDEVSVSAPSLGGSSSGSPSSLSSRLASGTHDQSHPSSPIALESATAISSARVFRVSNGATRRQVSSASSSRNIALRARLRSRSRSRSVGQVESNRTPLMSSSPCHEKVSQTKKFIDKDIYLEGPRVYTCSQCRTHFTSHDDIISKSFHGRHGRAYLFDQCVNITTGPPEDRLLITGLHSVCDIFCNRCKELVGWTYSRAYEHSQKYKEGKFIIEKINLHMEESQYGVNFPAGEKGDRWRKRSMSWGNDPDEIIYEYHPKGNLHRVRSMSIGSSTSVPPNIVHRSDIPSISSVYSGSSTRPFPVRSMSLSGPPSPRRF